MPVCSAQHLVSSLFEEGPRTRPKRHVKSRCGPLLRDIIVGPAKHYHVNSKPSNLLSATLRSGRIIFPSIVKAVI